MNTRSTPRLSKFVLSMEEAATIRMAQLARDLKSQGRDVIDLTIGEPDFVTPSHIRDAAKSALDEGRTRYSPVPGFPDLRQAIRTKLKRDNDIHVGENQIVVSNGAKQAIANACLALLDPGDEVLLPAPYWVSFLGIIKMAGGVPTIIETSIDQNFKVTSEQLESAITPRTRLLIFTTPSNPTGAVYTRKELENIARVIAGHEQIFILADEIYEYITFGSKHESIGSLPLVRDRTITVNGFSKGFAMTGWRLGYLAAPEFIARACTTIQGQFTSGACSFNQVAAITALLDDMEPVFRMRDAFRRRRDAAFGRLKDIPDFKVRLPEGAFFLFPDVSAHFGKRLGSRRIDSADEFAEALLEDSYVATISGTPFGDPRSIRISIAASQDDIERAIERIKHLVERLK